MNAVSVDIIARLCDAECLHIFHVYLVQLPVFMFEESSNDGEEKVKSTKIKYRRFILEIIEILQDCLLNDKKALKLVETLDTELAFGRLEPHMQYDNYETNNSIRDLNMLNDMRGFNKFWIEVVRRGDDGDPMMKNLTSLSDVARKFLVLPSRNDKQTEFLKLVGLLKDGPKFTGKARILLNAVLMIRSYLKVF